MWWWGGGFFVRACREGAFLIAHLSRYDLKYEVGKGERGHRPEITCLMSVCILVLT